MTSTPRHHAVPAARSAADATGAATPVVKLADTRDIVAMVPYSLGFTPRESFVALSFRRHTRPDGSQTYRMGLFMRVDLPEPESAKAARQLGKMAATHMTRDGADACVLVVYTDDAWCYLPLVDEVASHLEDAGVEVWESMHVGSHTWGSLTCDDDACCPAGGHPLADLNASPVAAEMVLQGRRVDPSRWERMNAIRPVDQNRVDSVFDMVIEYLRPKGTKATRARRRRAVQAWEKGMELALAYQRDPSGCPPPDSLDDHAMAALIAAFFDPTWRDSLMVEWARPGTLRESLESPEGPERELLQSVCTGDVHPEGERVEAAIQVLGALARVSDAALAPAVLAALGWLMWWTGDLGFGGDLACEALDLNESHVLAGIVEQLCGHGVPPGWIRAWAA